MQTKKPSKERRDQAVHRSIKLPPPPARRLTRAEAGLVMKRARKLGRQGKLTPHDFRLIDCLVFQAGEPLSGAVVISYSVLRRLTGMCRMTLVKGIKKLIEYGLLQRIKRRLRMPWHRGGTVSLQAPNAYLFNVRAIPDTESTTQPVTQELEITYISHEVEQDAAAARSMLAQASERMERLRQQARQEKIALARQQGRFVAM